MSGRRLSERAIVAALAVLVIATPRPAAAQRRAGLTAGAATIDLVVPSGTPLAGYGALARRAVPGVLGQHPHAFWFKSHVGQDDSVAARALVLEHDGTRVIWLAADVIAVDGRLTADVKRRLERAFGGSVTLMLSASHTHSGPGAFGDSRVMGFLAVDRPDREVRETIENALVTAARRADERRAPARIGVATAPGPDVTRARLVEPLDRELLVMKVARLDARPIALVWNFAIHPTMLPPHNLRLSGDVTGLAARALEAALGVPALYVNGAVGDVSPRRHGQDAAREVAGTLARAVQELSDRITPRDVAPPVTRSERVELGDATVSLRNCLGDWLPRSLTIPLARVFPREATLTAVGVGDTVWVTIPGEIQSALGTRVKQVAREHWRHAAIAGLTNEYLGYFVGPAEFDRRAYVTCVSLYGSTGGERLAAGASALLRALSGDQHRAAPGSATETAVTAGTQR